MEDMANGKNTVLAANRVVKVLKQEQDLVTTLSQLTEEKIVPV